MKGHDKVPRSGLSDTNRDRLIRCAREMIELYGPDVGGRIRPLVVLDYFLNVDGVNFRNQPDFINLQENKAEATQVLAGVLGLM